jgi:hypothetical protein
MIKLIMVGMLEKLQRLRVLPLAHMTKMYSEPKVRFIFDFSAS